MNIEETFKHKLELPNELKTLETLFSKLLKLENRETCFYCLQKVHFDNFQDLKQNFITKISELNRKLGYPALSENSIDEIRERKL